MCVCVIFNYDNFCCRLCVPDLSNAKFLFICFVLRTYKRGSTEEDSKSEPTIAPIIIIIDLADFKQRRPPVAPLFAKNNWKCF